jgi:hypothetical protein
MKVDEGEQKETRRRVEGAMKEAWRRHGEGTGLDRGNCHKKDCLTGIVVRRFRGELEEGYRGVRGE